MDFANETVEPMPSLRRVKIKRKLDINIKQEQPCQLWIVELLNSTFQRIANLHTALQPGLITKNERVELCTALDHMHNQLNQYKHYLSEQRHEMRYAQWEQYQIHYQLYEAYCHMYDAATYQMYGIDMFPKDDDQDRLPVGFVFTRYPSKRVYHHKKPIGDSMDVKMMTLPGWHVEIEQNNATLIIDPPKHGPSFKDNINPQSEFVNGKATFHDIYILGGIRLMPGRFRASAIIHCYHDKVRKPCFGTVYTKPSHDFMIVTNTNQWYHAERVFMERQLFGCIKEDKQKRKKNKGKIKTEKLTPPPPPLQLCVHWGHFLDAISHEFVQQTKQQLHPCIKREHVDILVDKRPFRPLFPFDLHCIIEWCYEYLWAPLYQSRFSVITQDMFFQFWEWFGKIVHAIRHNRTVRSLWMNGFIVSFITRTMAELLLLWQCEGAFLLRFSTKCADLVISYRGTNHVVRHVLLDSPNHGSLSSRSILLSLQENQNLQKMLVIDFDQNNARFQPKEAVLYKVVQKVVAKKEPIEGYDVVFL